MTTIHHVCPVGTVPTECMAPIYEWQEWDRWALQTPVLRTLADEAGLAGHLLQIVTISLMPTDENHWAAHRACYGRKAHDTARELAQAGLTVLINVGRADQPRHSRGDMPQPPTAYLAVNADGTRGAVVTPFPTSSSWLGEESAEGLTYRLSGGIPDVD